MGLSKNVGGRNRLVRALLTVVLAAAAIRSVRKGKRLNGLLAGVGAAALGYNATTGPHDMTETVGIDTTSEDGKLRCAVCGDPILPGQQRGPDANDEIVHTACKVSSE